MGKAEILSNIGDGRYFVILKRDASRLHAQITRAIALIDHLTPKRDDQQAKVTEAMEYIETELAEAWDEWEQRLEFIEQWEEAKLDTLSRPTHDDYGLLTDTNSHRGANPLTYDNGIRLVGLPFAQWLWEFARDNGVEAVTWDIAHSQGPFHQSECAELFEYMDSFGENVIVVENMADRMREVVGMWMGSPGHARNIQDPKFTHCGIGVHIGSDGVGVAVQLFVGIYPRLIEDQLEKIDKIIANKREWEAVQRDVDMMTLEIAAHETNLNRWNALLATINQDVREVWCADYTDNIESGIMPTADINGEPGHIILQPTYREPYTEPAPGEMQTEFNCLPSGDLLPIGAMSPAQAAFSWAILPGWQKWRPTYRLGEIVELDTSADTCSVILDGAWSVAQSLHINQGTGRLDNVPVDYMTCNAAAFEVGDRVLVEFQGQRWDEPMVIGFEKEPKECGGEYFVWYKDRSGVDRVASFRLELSGSEFTSIKFIGDNPLNFSSRDDSSGVHSFGGQYSSSIRRWPVHQKKITLGGKRYVVSAANQRKNFWETGFGWRSKFYDTPYIEERDPINGHRKSAIFACLSGQGESPSNAITGYITDIAYRRTMPEEWSFVFKGVGRLSHVVVDGEGNMSIEAEQGFNPLDLSDEFNPQASAQACMTPPCQSLVFCIAANALLRTSAFSNAFSSYTGTSVRFSGTVQQYTYPSTLEWNVNTGDLTLADQLSTEYGIFGPESIEQTRTYTSVGQGEAEAETTGILYPPGVVNREGGGEENLATASNSGTLSLPEFSINIAYTTDQENYGRFPTYSNQYWCRGIIEQGEIYNDLKRQFPNAWTGQIGPLLHCGTISIWQEPADGPATHVSTVSPQQFKTPYGIHQSPEISFYDAHYRVLDDSVDNGVMIFTAGYWEPEQKMVIANSQDITEMFFGALDAHDAARNPDAAEPSQTIRARHMFCFL